MVMSSIEKFTYSLSHREFYEPLDRFAAGEMDYFHMLQEALPGDWNISRNGIWLNCAPPNHRLLAQGWKIHLSAVRSNAERLFGAVAQALIENHAAFKIAAAPSILSLLVSKAWHRGGAGKFMTIYPHDSTHFISLIEALRQAATGHEGPYILSDRRYKDSKCVFYRYGGIAPRSLLTNKGDRTPFLESPSGEQIPDRRQAWFNLPPWVQDPFVPEAATSAPANSALNGGRYLVEASLRHSNSGGVYIATDTKTSLKVVIKEARPLTNVNASGVDSRALLKKEYRLLTKLEAERIAPRPIGFFQEWEHWFLVEEFLDGMTLQQHSVLHNVTKLDRPSPTHFREFYTEFRSVFDQLAKILDVLERHRIVFRDLSSTNVFILKDGRVNVIDFEAACELDIDPMINLFTPGFASYDHFSGDLPQFENDYYSLGALMMSYLMPIHTALDIDPNMKDRFIQAVGDDYGFPESVMNLMTRLMSPNPAKRPKPMEVVASLASPSPEREARIQDRALILDEYIRDVISRTAQYIVGQASFDRTDRLFPADPKVFVTNPLSLAYGACGTAYALHKITGEVPVEIIDWILRKEITPEAYAPGLYIGMAGVAWALLELGFCERAEQILKDSRSHLLSQTHDIFYGLAGWGMAQLKFYHTLGDSRYLEMAVSAGRELLETRNVVEDGCHWGATDELMFGFAHGSSGVSLFLLYLYLTTGEKQFLHVGREALQFDLAQAVDLGEGLLWPNRNGPKRKVMPYWRYGSAGVGTALLRYCRVVDDDRYSSILQGIKRAAVRKYTVFPNQSRGLAGLGDILIDLANSGIDEEACMNAARKVASGIMLFQLDKGKEGIAFPGDGLWRISCDYSTGSAGIALFLHRLLTRRSPDFLLDDLLPITSITNLEQ
jgi:class III lanthionine synthetase